MNKFIRNILRHNLPALLFIFQAIVAYTGWLHLPDLRAEEPRRAVVSMEMEQSSDWGTPRIHGEPYYNKPPLFNWIQALSIRVFKSSSERTLRMVSILGFLCTALCLYLTQRKEVGKSEAFTSVMFLLLSADVLFYGSINAGEIDLFYGFLVFVQWVVFYSFWKRSKHLQMFVWSSVLCALGFLVKGPPSVVFQVLTISFWLISNRQWKLLFSWKHALGVLLFAGIVGGYFVWYDRRNGHGVAYLLNLFAESGQKAGAGRSWSTKLLGMLTYLPNLILISLPGTALFTVLVNKRLRRQLPRLHSFARFALFTLLVNIPVYMLAGRFVPRYNYMFLPLLAVLAAFIFQHTIHTKQIRIGTRSIWIFCLILLALTLSVSFYHGLQFTKNQVLWIILLTLAVPALGYAAHRKILSFFSSIALGILLLRIAFNNSILPGLRESTDYPVQCQQWVDYANGEEIHWTGAPLAIPVQFGSLFQDTLYTPPLLPYQIPYYLMRIQGSRMDYEPKPRTGGVYLSPEKPDSSVLLLNEYYDNWQNRPLYLYRKPADPENHGS